jgi:hypothetical protein
MKFPLSLILYFLLALVLGAYAGWVGPVAFVGDSFFLADPAKYLAGRSLPGGATLFFFYRPLVSLLWTPLYFIPDPRAILLAIQALNILLYAATIFPLRHILRGYVGLERRAATVLAAVLLLAPMTLIYAPMLLTEAIFIPIFVTLAAVIFVREKDPRWRWDILCGALIGLCYLTRHAGSIVPLAWCFAELSRCLRAWGSWPAFFTVLKKALVTGAAAGCLIVPWMVTEALLSSSREGAGNSLMAELMSDHSKALMWAVNLAEYLFWSPLGFVTLVGLLVILTSPRQTVRDPLACFVLAAAGLAILTTVLFQGSHWGGNTLTLNRYVAPYGLPLFTIALAYMRGCSGRYLVIAGALILGFFLLGYPRTLEMHFPDYLAWQKAVRASAGGLSLALCSGMGVLAAILLLCFWRARMGAAMVILGVSAVVLDVGAARYWRNVSQGFSAPAFEAAATMWDSTRRDGAKVIADTQTFFDAGDRALMVRCFYPDQLPELPLAEVLTASRSAPILDIVTNCQYSEGRQFGNGCAAWRISDRSSSGLDFLARAYPLTGDVEKIQPNFSGHRTPASLLQGKGELTIECAGNVPKSLALRLNVISPRIARNLRIGNRDGKSLVRIPIPAGGKKDGWHEIEAPLQLNPGENVVELIAEGQPVKFGRRETRLLVASELSVRAIPQ